MKHLFDIDIAAKYGVPCAVILENIGYWVFQNEANETNCHDGYYWTYNSIKGLKTIHPYLTEKQIRSAIEVLVKEDLIRTGEFNTDPFDHSKWYTLTEKGKITLEYQKGKSICPTGQIESPYRADHIVYNNASLDSSNKYKQTDINGEKENKEKEKRFAPPSVEEVDAYIKEQGYTFDAEAFVDFYASKGWKVGSQSMKDWRAACRTWQRRRDEDRKKDAEKNRKSGKVDDDFWETIFAEARKEDEDAKRRSGETG